MGGLFVGLVAPQPISRVLRISPSDLGYARPSPAGVGAGTVAPRRGCPLGPAAIGRRRALAVAALRLPGVSGSGDAGNGLWIPGGGAQFLRVCSASRRKATPGWIEDARRELIHGTINHGAQFVRAPYQRQPVTYFCRNPASAWPCRRRKGGRAASESWVWAAALWPLTGGRAIPCGSTKSIPLVLDIAPAGIHLPSRHAGASRNRAKATRACSWSRSPASSSIFWSWTLSPAIPCRSTSSRAKPSARIFVI